MRVSWQWLITERTLLISLLKRQLCDLLPGAMDIYKLDPLYDCYVKCPPALTVIVPQRELSLLLRTAADEGNFTRKLSRYSNRR